MLIIKGKVSTAGGPIEAAELKAGMLILDRNHRARKLLSVEEKTAAGLLRFKGSGAVLSAGAVILTAQGEKQGGGNVKMMTPTKKIIDDEAFIELRTAVGYELTVENGSNLFVDGYCVSLKGE